MSKISGPLLARIDIHIEVPAVEYKELSSSVVGTSSAEMRAMVVQARETQEQRFNNSTIQFNAQMTSRQIRDFCLMDSECQMLLKETMNDLGLSARAHDKVIRVARTIADLDGEENIQVVHLQEAVNYRLLDRNLWA